MLPILAGALAGGGLNLLGDIAGLISGQHSSATAYQRAVEDMRKAGLNPALAYGQGGASTVQGDFGGVGSAAMSGASTAKDLQLKDSQRQNVDADTYQKVAQTRYVDAQANQLMGESEARIASWRAEPGVKESQRFANEQRGNLSMQQYDQLQASFGVRLTAMIAGIQNTSQQTEAIRVARQIAMLGLPQAQAEAAFWKSWAGKAAPYVSFGTSTAGDVMRAFSPVGQFFGQGKPKWTSPVVHNYFGGRRIGP